MSFSRVSLFGVLATTTAVSAQGRTDPTLGGESLTYLGVAAEGQTFAPSAAYSLGPIPSSMAGFEVWRQSNAAETRAAGTDLTITCNNPRVGNTGGICEMFVSVHSCAACTSAQQIDGGLKGVLRSEGWTNTQCASTFSIGETEGLKMQTLRKQFADGESVTVTTTDALCHIAVFQRKASFDCATITDATRCNGIFACDFDLRSGSCASAFCPAPVGPHPPAPCTCAAN